MIPRCGFIPHYRVDEQGRLRRNDLREVADGGEAIWKREVMLPRNPPSANYSSRASSTHPGIRQRVLDDQNNIRRHVNVFVDGENVRFANGGATQVTNDSEVRIYPAISGG